MKNGKIKFLFCVLFFVALAAITFRCAWPEEMVFSASDLNIGRLAFKKYYLPEMLSGYYSANQVLGGGASSFKVFNILLACIPLKTFANAFYGICLVAGSLSMVWFLRLWKRSWCAAALGALIAFWVNSIMLAAGGHAYKLEVLVFAVLSLCFIEKAIRAEAVKRSIGYSILAGLLIGLMMIEQQDVAFLAGLIVGSYTIFRLVQIRRKATVRWVGVLAPIAVVALLLAGQTLIGSYKQNIAGAAAMQKGSDGNKDSKWDFITQWSMVPGEWPDLIAPGWGGWGSNDPDGPYWGIMGQSPEWESSGQGFRNFKITSKYIGVIAFLIGAFGLAGAFRCRKGNEDAVTVIFWGAAGLMLFWLSFGKFSILYKLVYHLPLIGSIRDQSKFLDLFQICVGIVAAFGLDWLAGLVKEKKEARKPAKWLFISGSAFATLMFLANIKYLIFPEAQSTEFAEMGFGSYAELMVRNMSSGWLHAAVLAGVCAGLGFVIWKGFVQARLAILILVAITAVDSLMLTSHYFKASSIAALEQGNGLINYLKGHQGNERTHFMDQNGIYNQWIASDGPYHKLNLFNIWQMPRMPKEYKEYLGKVGRNQIRLWQLSAVKYVAAPSAILQQLQQNPELGKQFKPVLNYQVPTAQGMRPDVLLEFVGSIPRFALYSYWESVPVSEHCEKLVTPSHNPLTTVLLDDSSECRANPENKSTSFVSVQGITTKRSATVEMETSAPAILRFSQRYQSSWNVFVDGEAAELLRLDYISMGVHVPAGSHVVEFKCPNSIGRRIKDTAVLIVSILGASTLLSKKGAKDKPRGGAV
jgi:hypothetical protein